MYFFGYAINVQFRDRQYIVVALSYYCHKYTLVETPSDPFGTCRV